MSTNPQKDYTPFAISNFRVGFDQAQEPWLIPRDAFPLMKNAHLYLGVLQRIAGYNLYARMSYRKEIQMTGTLDGANKVFTATLSPLPTTNSLVIQSTINAGATIVETFSDNGSGVLTGTNGGTGTINYLTGAVSVTFGAAAPVQLPAGANVYNSVILSYDFDANDAPIMGIKPFYNANGSQDILIFDTKRVGKIVVLNGTISTQQQADFGVEEIPHQVQAANIVTGFNNTVGPFTGTLASTLLTPGTVVFYVFDNTGALLDTITDNGAGLLSGSTVDPAGNNYINYATGQWSLLFTGNQPNTNTVNTSVCVYGNIFTGTFSNFFDVANYQGKAFFTNSVDPPMYYDGTCIHYLNTNLTSKPTSIAPYDINKVLHIAAHRERLLLISCTVLGVPALNAVYWSAAQAPLDFINGGNLFAPTSEQIRTNSVINAEMVIRFSNSEYRFTYTADAFSPFRFDKTNTVWRCDAPYSAINYDSYFTSVGKPAIVASNGVNVVRADEIIPDFTLNSRIDEETPVISIDQTSIQQCYGERFDDFKEGWLCYKGYDQGNTGVVEPSDTVLAFNYIDETYAVYTFPFSCLGFGTVIDQQVWNDNFDLWSDAEYTWDTYTQTANALVDLGGDQVGNVYIIGDSYTLGVPTSSPLNPVRIDVVTKDFNPFVEEGELCRFGYIDFLVSSNTNTKFRVQFYADNEIDANFDSYYKETTLTLASNTNSKIWKRIYVGAVGKCHTMRIYQNLDDFTQSTLNQPVKIHAMVLYMKPAGRIFG